MDDQQFEVAAYQLEGFVQRTAMQFLRISLGLRATWTACNDAPETYDELMHHFQDCLQFQKPFKVSAKFCEDVVYPSEVGNLYFRLWHDLLHVHYQKDFTLASELWIGTVQSNAVAFQFGTGSLEHKIMLADTVGQSLYAEQHNGEFPKNQREFVRAWIDLYNKEF